MSYRSLVFLQFACFGFSLNQSMHVAAGQEVRQKISQRLGREQRSLRKREVPRDRITVEMQIGTERGARPLQAQQWSQLLQRLNVGNLSIRPSNADDQIEVTEAREPGGRHLVIRGRIDARGRLIVPGHVFTLRDSSRIGAWLAELKRYGPTGSPEGKPLWGLSEPEFRRLFSALSLPTGRSFTDTPVAEALAHFRVRSGVPIVLDTLGRREQLSRAGSLQRHRNAGSVTPSGRVDFEHASLSLGTALAVILHEQRLAFRVEVTRDREVRLAVLSAAACPDPWPIGWPRRAQQSLQELAPKLMEFTPVKLVNAPLDKVFHALERDSEIPFLYDGPAVAAGKINLSDLRVDYEKPRAYRKQILDRAAFSARLKAEVRTDEAGTPFVWVSPMRSARRAASSSRRTRPSLRRTDRTGASDRPMPESESADKPRTDS